MKKRIIAFVLVFCAILSITAWAADEPTATAEPLKGAHWEKVSSGAKVWKNSIGTQWVHAWYVIKNTGDVPLYLESASMDIEDKDGELLQTLRSVSAYPQVLKPGEVGVYDECTITDEDLPTKGLKIHFRPKVEEATVKCIRYSVKNFKVKTDKYKNTKGKGKVENKTKETADGMIYVCALCFNEKGSYRGLLWTIITDDIPAGDYLGFETMSAEWKVKEGDYAKVVKYAYPYQYQW